jgi:signal transduction histidine kinase
MILHKKIIIEKNFNATPKININSYLADILFSNIIGNAIRHNNHDGKINIELNPDSVKISNSGPSPGIDPEKLFERFQKGNVSSESAGLGLSIVKQVCNIYNFTLKYKYSEGLHTINIKF